MSLNILDFYPTTSTSDDVALNSALDELNSIGGGQLFLPIKPNSFSSKTYDLTTRIKKSFNFPIELVGEVGTTITANTASITELLIFENISNEISVRNLIFDGKNNTDRLLCLYNYTQQALDTAGVKVIDCTFKNALGFSGEHKKASAIRVRGGFHTVNITRCNIKEIKSPIAISTGIEITPYSEIDSNDNILFTVYTKNTVLTDCVIEDVYDSNEDPDKTDSDGIKVFAPSDVDSTSLTVKGCLFRDCKKRSIKSQVKNNIVTSSSFYRNQRGSITADVDFQYGGGIATNNIFYYNVSAPTSAIGGTVYEEFRGINVSNNLFTYKSISTECNVVSVNVDSNIANYVNGVTVDANKIQGYVTSILKMRLGLNDNNYCIVKDNYFEKATDAFIVAWHSGNNAANPVLRGVFSNNIAIKPANNAFNSGGSVILPNVWKNNQNIKIEYGGPGQITSIEGMDGSSFYKRMVISGSILGNTNSIIPINVDYWGSTVKIKATFTYASNDDFQDHAILEAYVTRNSSGSFVTEILAFKDPQFLGKWTITAADANTINLKKEPGDLSSSRPFWVVIEGNNVNE